MALPAQDNILQTRCEFTPRSVGTHHRLGSGYLITDSLILTCAHVLNSAASGRDFEEAESVEVCFWERHPDSWLEATPIWSDTASDLALLQLKGPIDNDSPARLGSLSDEIGAVRWRSAGYPVASALTPDTPEAEAVWGETDPISLKGAGQLALSVHSRFAKSQSTRTQTGWSGLSGSAVFISGALVGVITSVPTTFDRSVEGTRITKAFESSLFKGLVGLDAPHRSVDAGTLRRPNSVVDGPGHLIRSSTLQRAIQIYVYGTPVELELGLTRWFMGKMRISWAGMTADEFGIGMGTSFNREFNIRRGKRRIRVRCLLYIPKLTTKLELVRDFKSIEILVDDQVAYSERQ